MRILFTGASSFTGHWFVRQLADAGHEVTVTFTRGDRDEYPDAVRRQRAARVMDQSEPIFACRFGDDRFLGVVAGEHYDVLCHHAAEAADYRSPDFDVSRAVAANTLRLRQALELLQRGGGNRVVLTGTVFEGGEGAGSDGLPHISPYGLSKALTAATFSYYCQRAGVRLAKFVIANPFGPYEEERFTAYLMQKWFAGQKALVRTPLYVRDNIHVSLLARAYVAFVESLNESTGFQKTNPSGYVESQAAFTERVAVAMRHRIGRPCELEFGPHPTSGEPLVRINTDPLDSELLRWDEPTAWDDLAEWYRDRLCASVGQ